MTDSFLSCDWGTSAFRLRLVDRSPLTVVKEVAGNQGIRSVFDSLPDRSQESREVAFGAVLGRAIDELLQTTPEAKALPVVLSGMASSTIGWRELPYATVPFELNGSTLQSAAIELTTPLKRRHCLHLISGLATQRDIIRGEESELVGLATLELMQTRLDDCLVVLPGTHSKHITVENSKVTGFQTYMTGELFDVLANHSVLASTVSLEPDTEARSSGSHGFLQGVGAARDRGFMPSLFQARTRSVLQDEPTHANREFLSGLLIGAELASLKDAHDRPIVLAAPPQLTTAYQEAAMALELSERMVIVPEGFMKTLAIRGHAQYLHRFSNQ